GKNLFATLARNSGYEVLDLGVKVSKEEIEEKIKEYRPDVLGLSGLLTRSCFEMVEVAEYLSRNESVPVMILGGAALTENFVKERIAPKYKKKVFYAKSAMEGVRILNELFSKKNI
ncbi:MAG: cobalamin-dependent protein, partial [candidate division WOR-3 bacterium]